MAYKINTFLHCDQNGSDKIWGYVTLGEPGCSRLYNFWGKRGKRLSFQEHDGTFENGYELRRKAEEKCRPGRSSGVYREIPVAKIEELCPGWINDFEKQLTLAKLFENFRGRKQDEEV